MDKIDDVEMSSHCCYWVLYVLLDMLSSSPHGLVTGIFNDLTSWVVIASWCLLYLLWWIILHAQIQEFTLYVFNLHFILHHHAGFLYLQFTHDEMSLAWKPPILTWCIQLQILCRNWVVGQRERINDYRLCSPNSQHWGFRPGTTQCTFQVGLRDSLWIVLRDSESNWRRGHCGIFLCSSREEGWINSVNFWEIVGKYEGRAA